mmetsp:Transcript_644/g.1722  ORF Transcript_644/g.1722 Transcript_644/m.1722 type:complete len:228 (+) Transcript_644:536-1219(+)
MHVHVDVPNVVQHLGIPRNSRLLQGSLGIDVQHDGFVLAIPHLRESHLEPLSCLLALSQSCVGAQEAHVVVFSQVAIAHVPEARLRPQQSAQTLLVSTCEKKRSPVDLIGVALPLFVQPGQGALHHHFTCVEATLVRRVEDPVRLCHFQPCARIGQAPAPLQSLLDFLFQFLPGNSLLTLVSIVRQPILSELGNRLRVHVLPGFGQSNLFGDFRKVLWQPVWTIYHG